jgi:hypothetical protein
VARDLAVQLARRYFSVSLTLVEMAAPAMSQRRSQATPATVLQALRGGTVKLKNFPKILANQILASMEELVKNQMNVMVISQVEISHACALKISLE